MVQTRTIYFDESGNTGPHLLDPHQKFFSVGSTDLTDAESRVILQEHFPRQAGGDIKFRKLFRDSRNHDALIDFAKTVGQQPKRFFCHLTDKRFALLCRLVDWFVEPIFHEQGFDWYKDDYGLSWVNIFHLGFRLHDNTETLLEDVTGLYADLVRDPTRVRLEAMQRRYRELAENGPEAIALFMGYVSAGADDFDNNFTLDGIANHNDVHVASLVSSVGWWRDQHPEDFEIIHDESTYFFKRQHLWDVVTSMTASSAVVRVAHKSISFPLRVKKTSKGDSKQLSSLQICDLIAGFVARTKAGDLTDEQREVIEAMVAAGMGEICFDCVAPGTKYAQGLPPLADGPDAVDQVVLATRRRPT